MCKFLLQEFLIMHMILLSAPLSLEIMLLGTSTSSITASSNEEVWGVILNGELKVITRVISFVLFHKFQDQLCCI